MDLTSAGSDQVTRERALEIALAIGRRLLKEAFVVEDRCTWLGIETQDSMGQPRPALHRPLSRWLYDGTAGVAVFLAALHRVSSAPEMRELAEQALRHAIRNESVASPGRGLFSGWSGVIHACLVVSAILEEAAWRRVAHDLACSTMLRDAGRGREFDLIGGHAGDLLVMLRLLEDRPSTELRATAIGLGDRLRELAREDGAGVCWEAPAEPGRKGLVGLSHGAAGAALALVDLHRWSGRQDHLEVARRALEYEQSTYAPSRGNWPDLRGVPLNARRPRLQFSVFWCHGAPGIVLSRLAILRHQRWDGLGQDVAAGLATTRAEIREYLQRGEGNLSLCHGLCGLGEVLLVAHREGAGSADDIALVARIVEQVHRNHVQQDLPWPCGTHGAETPGLMLGLAGMGMFHLRVVDPTLPSPLCPWDRLPHETGRPPRRSHHLGAPPSSW